MPTATSPNRLGQSGREIDAMKRLHQVLLIGTFLPLCWLAMMAVHETGFPSGLSLERCSAQTSGLAQPKAESIIGRPIRRVLRCC